MSGSLSSLKKDIAKQKDIFRLAAMIYSETSGTVSESETQLQIVKCMFIATGNEYLTRSEMITHILNLYKYHVTEDELDFLIKKSRGVFQSVKRDGVEAYCLTTQAKDECTESQAKNIDSFVDKFVEEFGIVEAEKCKSAIHMYLYELTTTNINTYRVLLTGKTGEQFTNSEIMVDVFDLNDEEKEFVNKFLSWDNIEKNIALSNLVYCCLEYCLLINGDSPNSLLKNFIKRREVYLDTNIIFRALGINGESRKQVILAFLNKCKQAKLKLIIAHNTQKEFFDTIDYYISQIMRFPKGTLPPGAYEQITDYNIYAFFEKWSKDRPNVSLLYFRTYIKSLYLTLVKQYNITDGEKIPREIYDSDTFKEVRNTYSSSIKRTKQELKEIYVSEDDRYSSRDSHDAAVVRYIELQREKYGENKDVFLASSDKCLRYWDINRQECQYPVVIYPSQLFLILLKTCGRSQDDYNSFVHFINIKPTSKQISPDKAHIILSGISSITEDIETQENLIASVFDDDFQSIIKYSASDEELYQKVQEKSKCYLDEELRQSKMRLELLEKDSGDQKAEILELKGKLANKDKAMTKTQVDRDSKAAELEKNRDKITKFAETKIQPLYIWKTIIAPIILAMLTVSLVIFIALHFFFGDKTWNFAVIFYNWVKETPFGLWTGDFMYTIDFVFISILGYALKRWMRNPFDKFRREETRMQMVEDFIKNNNLG